jgi:hypothetical protein
VQQPCHHLFTNIKRFAQFLAFHNFSTFCEIEFWIDWCLAFGLQQQAFVGSCICFGVSDVRETAKSDPDRLRQIRGTAA